MGAEFQETSRKLQTDPKERVGCYTRRLQGHCRPADVPAGSRVLDDTTINKSDAVLINGLKRLWQKEGRLSESIIDKSVHVPAMNTYYRRFGTLRQIYRLIGYPQCEEYFQRRDKAAKTEQLRADLVAQIATSFPESVTLLGSPPKRRRLLLVDGHVVVSVYMCRSTKWPNGRPCWRFDPVAGETHNVTLSCTMTVRNDDVETFYLFRSLGRTGNYKFGPGSKWLAKATRLSSIVDFHDAVTSIAGHLVPRL